MRTTEAPGLAEVRAARERLRGLALRTPLVPLNADAAGEIHLKLENLQPIGSFKIRGAGNALLAADPDRLAWGVVTPSAGNMGQGVAWVARRLGVGCTVVVPDHAPQTKLAALERLGAKVVSVPFDTWWQVILDHEYAGVSGAFIHPVSDTRVMAGNGTIGLEILEDLPGVDTVLIPYGGGGLSCGIASALRAVNPAVGVIACEVETATPLTASLAAGKPVPVEYEASFVDGIGGKNVLEEMWPLARDLIDGTVVVTLDEVRAALRILFERHRVVAEGAGAVALAAALSGRAGSGRMACVVSGGCIDFDRLATILA